eukprot:5169106-Pyramimonas_sp.AAC.1
MESKRRMSLIGVGAGVGFGIGVGIGASVEIGAGAGVGAKALAQGLPSEWRGRVVHSGAVTFGLAWEGRGNPPMQSQENCCCRSECCVGVRWRSIGEGVCGMFDAGCC